MRCLLAGELHMAGCRPSPATTSISNGHTAGDYAVVLYGPAFKLYLIVLLLLMLTGRGRSTAACAPWQPDRSPDPGTATAAALNS